MHGGGWAVRRRKRYGIATVWLCLIPMYVYDDRKTCGILFKCEESIGQCMDNSRAKDPWVRDQRGLRERQYPQIRHLSTYQKEYALMRTRHQNLCNAQRLESALGKTSANGNNIYAAPCVVCDRVYLTAIVHPLREIGTLSMKACIPTSNGI